MATKKTDKKTATHTTVSVERSTDKENGLLERMQSDLQKNQSILNLVLGGLIVIVLGVLLFNFFNKPTDNGSLGPAQNTQNQPTNQTADVTKDKLPGKYTVKDGDTLFTIAQQYYDDGYKYDLIVKANQLTDENVISKGLVLEIPKPDGQTLAQAQASPTPPSSSSTEPSPTDVATPTPTQTPAPAQVAQNPQSDSGTGGATNETIWGERITGNTYTVQEGDWLSKISGRVYGDIMQYQKIAEANHISNPDVIEPGTVLQIPK